MPQNGPVSSPRFLTSTTIPGPSGFQVRQIQGQQEFYVSLIVGYIGLLKSKLFCVSLAKGPLLTVGACSIIPGQVHSYKVSSVLYLFLMLDRVLEELTSSPVQSGLSDHSMKECLIILQNFCC